MQNLENSGFKVAEENLMGHVRQGRDALVQTREDIASGNIKRNDKYEELFDRLNDIKLEPQLDIQKLKNGLKSLIEELECIIHNKA